MEDSFIDQDSLKQAKRDFEEGEVVGIKVPINIFPHELNEGKYIPKKTVISYANFYIQKNSDTLTMLLRQGLIISEEPLKLTRLPVFSLLLIEEASLSKFALRAERDNHVKFDFKKMN